MLWIGVIDGVLDWKLLEWILGVEPWQVILEWNQKLNSSGEICLGVNETIVKCVTNA